MTNNNINGLRPDLRLIFNAIPFGSRVLDIGCGDGDLLDALKTCRDVDASGIDFNQKKIAIALTRGLSVFQGDAEEDLSFYPDLSFDYVVLSQTLQTVKAPDRMIDNILRIGRYGFVSFPNFAHWRIRLALLWQGKMPITNAIPQSWYNTPNIHHLTIKDFNDILRQKRLKIEQNWFLGERNKRNERRPVQFSPNLRAQDAIFLIRRMD